MFDFRQHVLGPAVFWIWSYALPLTIDSKSEDQSMYIGLIYGFLLLIGYLYFALGIHKELRYIGNNYLYVSIACWVPTAYALIMFLFNLFWCHLIG